MIKDQGSPSLATPEGHRTKGEGLNLSSAASVGATAHSHLVLLASCSNSVDRPRLPALIS